MHNLFTITAVITLLEWVWTDCFMTLTVKFTLMLWTMLLREEYWLQKIILRDFISCDRSYICDLWRLKNEWQSTTMLIMFSSSSKLRTLSNYWSRISSWNVTNWVSVELIYSECLNKLKIKCINLHYLTSMLDYIQFSLFNCLKTIAAVMMMQSWWWCLI